MIPTISLRRVRAVLEPEYVAATAHALVTGAPIAARHAGYVTPAGSDMPRIWLNDHVFSDSHAKFVPRDTEDLRTLCDRDLPKFTNTDYPVEFNYISIEYGTNLIHASATLHHAGECEPAGPLFFANHCGPRFIAATTRTHTSDSARSLTPRDDAALDRLVFDPDSEVRYKAVDPARLLDIATVRRSSWGPALDDPIWTKPLPRPGTDLAFDSDHPRGIHAEYLLLRNGSNVALR